MKKVNLNEIQRAFLKNYERMTDSELANEIEDCVFGSIGWPYCQLEFQRRRGEIKIKSNK